MADVKCLDEPVEIRDQRMCLNPVSKNMKGELDINFRDRQKCDKPDCITFKIGHTMKLEVDSHPPCDSKLGSLLDGTISVERLFTAFDHDGHHRGFHAGDFEWSGSGFRASGRMSGMTNVGTHREPHFKDCQRCDNLGVMEGRICGQVEAKMPELNGCQIFGSYRINFDPGVSGASGTINGVIEGVLICPCQ